MREVTAVTRLAADRAILFGKDWNATVKGDPKSLDEIARRTPGVVVDIVKPLK